VNIRLATIEDAEVVVSIWLRSVRATHTFLQASDIDALLPHVREYVDSKPDLWMLCTHNGDSIGFMGLGEDSIDALFIAPEWIGCGGGRAFIQHAREQLNRPLRVDVNEENARAVRFYIANGFHVTGRSALDDGGRPFPLLHLRETVKCESES
jgi:putative acetyltransferase